MTGYEGVKYQTIIEREELPDDHRIGELREWCRIFHENGLAPAYPGGTHGNMSFRTAQGEQSFIITAARTSFSEELPGDSFYLIKRVVPEKMLVYAEGNRLGEPSSESLLHHAIYRARPDVQAILHGHCASISRQSHKMGIPTTLEYAGSGTLKITESVLRILEDHSFVEILQHGFLAMGNSIEAAGRLSLGMLELSRHSGGH